MKRISSIKRIFNAYSGEPFATKLFISIRYLVCPWDDIIRSLEGKSNLLDIGCGHGLLLHLAKERYPAIISDGTDHDEAKIEIAKRSSAGGDMNFLHDYEMKDNVKKTYDAITLIDVLYSVPIEKWGEILSFAKERLSPGGSLIIKETVNSPKWKYYICLFQEIMAVKILKYTKGEATELPPCSFYVKNLEDNGFRVTEERRVDYGYIWPHYLFVARAIKA